MKDNLDLVIVDLKNRIQNLKDGTLKSHSQWVYDLSYSSELESLVSRLQKIKDATQQQTQGIH